MAVSNMESSWYMEDLYNELKEMYGLNVDLVFPHDERAKTIPKEEYEQLLLAFKQLLTNPPLR